MAVWAVVLFGLLGMSVDIGRLIINKNEAQMFADSAALAAALQLDGTSAGVTNAKNQVSSSLNRWDFETQTIPTPTVEFATAGNPDTWVASPLTATGYTNVRVTVNLTQNLFFMPVKYSGMTQAVNAQAVAQQTQMTTMYQGLFPFAPLAFNSTGPHYGLIPGVPYTMRYPASKHASPCTGDLADANHAKDGGERGYWGDNSASVLRKRVVSDYQTSNDAVVVGQVLNTVSGAKTTIATSLNERAAQDTDDTSTTWAAYVAGGNGNGRRVVVMPIQDMNTNVVYSFGQFLLLTSGSYDHTGNAAWCAIYIGEASLPNTNHSGAGSTPGAYQVKLIN